jgi:glycosyltransferase involved in cell wall biosynthesis
MIRVLHYTRHLGLGGTEKTCQLFFEHADRSRFEVALAYEALGTHPRKSEFEKSNAVCGGTMHSVHSYRDPQDPNGADLRLVIKDFKPDILHVYRSGYREFPEPGEHVEVPHFVETNVFGFYDGNAKVSKTLFMSKWLMDDTMKKLRPISRGIIPSRFDFINNPVEQPYTHEILPIAERWRHDNAIIVGRCGRPDNGIYNSVSIDAVRLLRMQGYDIRFLVVAPPSNMVNDLAKYEIPFHMIEPTVDPLVLSTFYNSVDIYTHARADGETFGVNIAEAMMHGKPVITHIATPSVPGMGVFQSQTELVNNGQTGFVVNNNPGEYAEALMTLIEDAPLRNKMGEFGRLKAEAEYKADVCVHKLERIYEEITHG